MALPIKQKTWTYSLFNRIAFVSLLDTMQRYLHGVKTFLKANGYTIKGSASAGTGAMDGVDRWTATTDVTPRASTAGASQAWIVLVDASGAELLLAYMGGSDDVMLQAICADGVGFVAAGTPNQQPTAVNQQTMTSGTSVIGSTTSGDRLWSGWVDSQHKMCRFAIASAGLWVGRLWGMELVAPIVASPSVFSPPVWGFSFPAGGSNIVFSAQTAGRCRIVASSTSKLCTVIVGAEYFGVDSFCDNIKAPAQGGLGYLMYGLSIATVTAGAEGKLANLIDWWAMQGSSTIAVPGDTMGSLSFIHMGTAGNGRGILWWSLNGATPVMA